MTVRPPFEAPTAERLIDKILSDELVRPIEFQLSVSDLFEGGDPLCGRAVLGGVWLGRAYRASHVAMAYNGIAARPNEKNTSVGSANRLDFMTSVSWLSREPLPDISSFAKSPTTHHNEVLADKLSRSKDHAPRSRQASALILCF
ncbi:unnamed protein product [marine sediment metagenome]|uniref:Uncharacterized protein n=1 Tax=marine sediment metagenome TaxID=412755 RepID=X0ZEX4_9ZZZZ